MVLCYSIFTCHDYVFFWLVCKFLSETGFAFCFVICQIIDRCSPNCSKNGNGKIYSEIHVVQVCLWPAGANLKHISHAWIIKHFNRTKFYNPKIKVFHRQQKTVSYSDKWTENVHNSCCHVFWYHFAYNTSQLWIHAMQRRYRQYKSRENTHIKSHFSNVHLIEKVDKITYISNWLDFFGRSNLEFTKKRSFTRVSGRRKRCNSARLYGDTNARNLIFQICMFSHDK